MFPVAELPPHNIEAEQALLGSILLNNSIYGLVAGAIGPEHFFEPLHGQILYQAGQMIVAGKAATPVSLKDAFPNSEIADGVTIAAYLARLTAEGSNTPTELNTFIERIRDLAQMRGIIETAETLKKSGPDGIFPEGALEGAWQKLDGIRNDNRQTGGNRGPLAKFARTLLDQEASYVVSTGLTDLDRAIAGGWRSGRLYILAGRPGMGKTVIGLSSGRRVARKGNGVSIFSLEIDTNEVTARIAADEISRSLEPVPYRDIVSQSLTDAQKAKVQEALRRLEEYPVQVDASGGLTMSEIESRARIDRERFAKQGKRLSVVLIDYLGLIRASDRYRGNRVNELGEVALAGKTMAKRLDCAVVLLSQLNRQVESRDDKRPTMSDLRDSGNIEEHADFVGLLYRPFYYTERSPKWLNQDPDAVQQGLEEQHSLELIIGKNRLGSTGAVHLWCDPALSAVDNKGHYR